VRALESVLTNFHRQLLFDGDASVEAYEYIDEIVKKALRLAGTPAAVPWRLLVGWRDFHAAQVSAWHRAEVSTEPLRLC
jgi:hypothetical protein